MIDNSNLKPRIRFKDFRENWRLTTLEKVAKGFKYGLNAASKDYDGVNKYIRITDIGDNGNLNTNANVSPDCSLSDDYLVEINEILLARTGATVGKSYLYNRNDGLLYYAGYLIKASIIEDCNSKFVFEQLQTKRFWDWVKITSSRSGQPGINAEEYRKFPIWCPDILEQTKIAEFFTILNERIQTQQSIVENLEKLKKGYMQKIFSQELRFKDENGEDFPEWEERQLNSFANIYQPETISVNDSTGGSYRIFGANGYIGYYEKYNHFSEQVAISCRGNAGTVNYIDAQSWITGNSMVINVDKSLEVINKKFLYFCLQNDDLRYMVSGSGQPQITKKDVEKHVIKLPFLAEQEMITKFLINLEQKIIIEKQKTLKLQELKSGYLQQMFI